MQLCICPLISLSNSSQLLELQHVSQGWFKLSDIIDVQTLLKVLKIGWIDITHWTLHITQVSIIYEIPSTDHTLLTSGKYSSYRLGTWLHNQTLTNHFHKQLWNSDFYGNIWTWQMKVLYCWELASFDCDCNSRLVCQKYTMLDWRGCGGANVRSRVLQFWHWYTQYSKKILVHKSNKS